jgi:hypothetical protein
MVLRVVFLCQELCHRHGGSLLENRYVEPLDTKRVQMRKMCIYFRLFESENVQALSLVVKSIFRPSPQYFAAVGDA